MALLALQPQLLARRDLALLHAVGDAIGLARLPVVHAPGLVLGQRGRRLGQGGAGQHSQAKGGDDRGAQGFQEMLHARLR